MNTFHKVLERKANRFDPMPWVEKLKNILKIGALLLLGVSMSACSKTSWKEEVLLHDGSKIVVERSQSYGGRHEFTQRSPIKEHDIIFTLPSTNKTITWKDEFDETIGYSDLNLLALHILNGTPYIVTSPHICLSYNKWGRPNPPYVIFKHDGNAWQRIQLTEFPGEFKAINLLVSTYGHGDVDREIKSGFVSIDSVKELNSISPQ